MKCNTSSGSTSRRRRPPVNGSCGRSPGSIPACTTASRAASRLRSRLDLPARAIPAIIAPVAGRAAGARTFALSDEVYDRHVGRYGPSLAAAFLDLVGLPDGASALDVGCGPGALTGA